MNQLCNLSLNELKEWVCSRGEKAFRALQIFEWIYQKKVSSFEEMTNLPKAFREELAQNFLFPSLKLLRTQVSEDGETVKFLWELSDQKKVESVLIYAPGRRTVCVSSQVGCPARCAFCASGKEGLLRNLSAAEIIEQVLSISRVLREKEEVVSHVVFMGMGEPFENYDAVVTAIDRFTSKEGMGLSQRRITVSTVGVLKGIEKLSREERFRVNLVFSLHAPSQHLRKKLIPYARRYDLEELLLAMENYQKRTKRDITYEYTLLRGINDQIEQAEELATLLQGKQCTVNLIPYNPVDQLKLERPKREAIEAFRDHLERRGIVTTWRYTKGKDIAAACGQLALQ